MGNVSKTPPPRKGSGGSLSKCRRSSIGKPIRRIKSPQPCCSDQTRSVRRMVKRFKGNRHQQLGLRQSERLGPAWKTICTAVSNVWKQDWETLAAGRGNAALPAAWYLARDFGGLRLAELGSAAGDVAYSAVSMATTRSAKRLKVDHELQRPIKADERFCSFDGFGVRFLLLPTLKVRA
jgi:hypothetical protein